MSVKSGMRCALLALGLLQLPMVTIAESARSKAEPARIMLLGLFHFDNPGLDAVRYQPIDVMQAAPQAYLEKLSERIAEFAPTRVLLEYSDRQDALINQRYSDYLADRFELPRNEIYQLGFRIAKQAGHARVHGFDQAAPPFDAKLWAYLPQHAPAIDTQMQARIKQWSSRLEQQHRTLSLEQLLRNCNTPAEDRANKGFYLLLNSVDARERLFHGADAAAHWWQRNFRMYAVVQSHAQPGERVLVIAGSGHTAILRDLLGADSERAEVNVLPYLQTDSPPARPLQSL